MTQVSICPEPQFIVIEPRNIEIEISGTGLAIANISYRSVIEVNPGVVTIEVNPDIATIEVVPNNFQIEVAPVANLILDAGGLGDKFASHGYPTVISNQVILIGDEPYIIYLNPQNSFMGVTLPDARVLRNRQYKFLNISRQHDAVLRYFEGGQVTGEVIINKDSSFWVHSDGVDWTGVKN